jgi:hypothetical protein
MASQSQRISTQEAKIRISLKLSRTWHELTEKQILSLRSRYRNIIEKGILLVSGYDSSLKDIRKGASQIEAICPYEEDSLSKDDKRQALEQIGSTLAKHGLPYPIPAGGAELLRLKEQWPTLRVKRRRIIRQELCKRYSLPLNSAWEEITKKQRWFGENAGAEPTKTENTAHSFRHGICSRCGISHSAASRFAWKTCQPIMSASANHATSQTDNKEKSDIYRPLRLQDDINELYQERLLRPHTTEAHSSIPLSEPSSARTSSQLKELENVSSLSIIDIRILLEQNPKRIKTLAEAEKMRKDLEFAVASTTDTKQEYSSARIGSRLGSGKILISSSMRERLMVKIRHCESTIEFLIKCEKKRQENLAAQNNSKPAELKLPAYADQILLDELWNELSRIKPLTGYVYLKRWKVLGESAWYKIGITGNPERRDAEQNVLPVPVETLFCYDVGSIERARAIESKIILVLGSHKIIGAQNRELFHLSDEQVSALMAVMNAINT